MEKKISLGATIFGAYDQCFDNLLVFLKVCGGVILIRFGVDLLLMLGLAKSASFASAVATSGPIVFARIALEIVLYPIALVAWHRFVLLGEVPPVRWFYLGFGRREANFLLAALLLSAIGYGMFFGTALLMVVIAAGAGAGTGVLVASVYFVFIFAVASRLLLVFPKLAIDTGIALRAAWHLGRGNTWRLALGSVAVMAPVAVVIVVLEVVVDKLPTNSPVTVFLGAGLISTLLDLLFACLLAGFASLAYRALTAEPASPTKAASREVGDDPG